jgi:hypothetical protein
MYLARSIASNQAYSQLLSRFRDRNKQYYDYGRRAGCLDLEEGLKGLGIEFLVDGCYYCSGEQDSAFLGYKIQGPFVVVLCYLAI